jgi:HK97 family phage major capsid protein
MSKQALLGSSARLERKDDAPDLKTAVDAVNRGFEEFKAANDLRLKEIEKKGAADPLLDDKLGKLNERLDQYEGLNQRLVQAEGQKKALDELQEQYDRIETAMKRAGKGDIDEGEKKARGNDWARAVVGAHVQGIANLSDAERKAIESVNAEWKSLSVTADTAGGYLAPREFVQEIIKAEVLMSPVRSLARVRQTGMRSVQVPKRTGTFAAQWVAEQGTKSETTGLTYGLEEIPTHELYALVDISNQMLEDSAFDMQAEIVMEASEQFAVAEGAAFVSGTGVGKAEGFTSTAAGLSSSNSGSATTIADADGQANGLLSAKYAIKTAYARNATWGLNRTTLGSVRKLKDSQKNYIWLPGIQNGAPNTIDGDPYAELPDMPNEGAGTFPIVYGDFRRAYTWVDRISMEMLRDPYTQATSGNIRFIVRKRVGGQVVLSEALQLVKCST